MSKKIKVFINSGANAFSTNEEILTFDELGIESEEDFNKMTEKELFTLVTDTIYGFEWGAHIVDD